MGNLDHIDRDMEALIDAQEKLAEIEGQRKSGDLSDGYHTFNELYEHRHRLWILICNGWRKLSFKTRLNSEKEKWDGWFILGLNHPELGQISYHLPDRLWDACKVGEVAYNAHYDGHSSTDVLSRLNDFSQLI